MKLCKQVVTLVSFGV